MQFFPVQRQQVIVPAGQREWQGITTFPAPTQTALHNALGRLRNNGVDSLTILVLGKSGVGKSSTINSIFGERVCVVSAFQQETTQPVMIVRTRAGFTLNIVDTPGLVESGGVSDTAIAQIKVFLQDKAIDVVLFVERLDGYRIDSLDKQVMSSLTDKFGSQLWKNTVLVLTHGQFMPPEGLDYQGFVNRRQESLRSAITKAARFKRNGSLAIPVALAENTGRCATSDEGERILGDGTVWLPALVNKMVDVALDEARDTYTVPPEDRTDGNKKHRWLILPLFILQVKVLYPLFVKLVKGDVQKADSATRIEWGLPPAYIQEDPLKLK